ncbi:putative ATPase [Mycolicibacterium moriokaense]|uniref:Putative ATPase n=1 Tax=Mycolicibacterium moriokaense TaxID=39691 RepID=A0A318HBA7_9MYCO|nr:putative ATPase [Mycolicibacterium moriokaense]
MTFLFTDIEGSTRRWEADAEAMRAALSKHDQVLQTAIESQDGFLFSHTGDGVVAAFASPRSAVDAAVKAQLALELPVRMGIATGEAELRDGDYFGTVLNRAARVMAAGHGGQILVADSTAGLLSGVDLLDLGPRRLRDVPIPVGVFQVRSAGLRVEFPSLRALDTTPGNLRPATTSLIGRESEVDAITTAVRSHRLVTLTGVGGVGKTRLALEVAAQLADEFPDGVWVFELAAVTDPASVPDAVAAVLGITQQPGKTVSESVAAALEGRSRLLVFDNCEHVLDPAADIIEAIFSHSQTVHVLATSREGLRVADEHLWAVPSLDLTDGIQSSAAALFIERAAAVRQEVPLGAAGESAAVVEICRQLDGIPLGIELAASRMQSMTATEVCDRLGDRFRLLVGSRRGLERHQTLRHAVAWSYDLLDDGEKSVLNRCSVFAGGFDLAGAQAVTGSDDEIATLDLLDALVRKSLMVADHSSGRTRYSMLETIRQFAEEQLAATGQVGTARTTHAHHFATRETDVMSLWDGPRQREAYDWLTVELANLRTAFRWAADRGDLDDAATIATYAAFLGYCVEKYEPIAWAEEVIEPASAVDHPRLAFLYVVASQCFTSGRVDAAVRYSDAVIPVVESGRSEVPFGIESLLYTAYINAGAPELAAEWCRSRVQSGRDTHTVSRTCLILSLAVVQSYEKAIAATTGLIEAAEATGNPWVLSYALLAVGAALQDADPVDALQAGRRGLQVAEDSGNRGNGTFLAVLDARIEAEYGDSLRALHYIAVAIHNHHDSGNPAGMRAPMATLATILDRMGRYEPAATIAGCASTPFTVATYPELPATTAHLHTVLGDRAYESLARKGETMSTAEIAAYAYDQIDQARAELNAVSK